MDYLSRIVSVHDVLFSMTVKDMNLFLLGVIKHFYRKVKDSFLKLGAHSLTDDLFGWDVVLEVPVILASSVIQVHKKCL